MEAARPATAADVERIAALHRQALEEMRPLRGGALYGAREARHDPAGDDVAAALDDPTRAVWSGTIDEVVVGFAVAHVEDLRDGRRIGVIDDLYVEPEARGVAVGEVLMDAVRTWARASGCSGLDAVALPGDRQTKNFFEGSGFSARLIVMHGRLEPDGEA